MILYLMWRTGGQDETIAWGQKGKMKDKHEEEEKDERWACGQEDKMNCRTGRQDGRPAWGQEDVSSGEEDERRG